MRLADAGRTLGATPTHLVRAFSAQFGIAPHRYLTGRRLDRARRLLLAGERPAAVAVRVGFHDQAHLTRHFRRLLGTTPGGATREAVTVLGSPVVRREVWSAVLLDRPIPRSLVSARPPRPPAISGCSPADRSSRARAPPSILRAETTGGLLLIVAAVVGLVWANTPVA